MKYTEVLERPLPKRIPLRTMSSRQSREQAKTSKVQLASASKPGTGPWKTRCDSTASQWDWRTEGHVGEIRDQGPQCFACWAFATAAAFEARYMWIKYRVNSIGAEASWIRAAYSPGEMYAR